jgi:glycosyltransferase involved in cell wall biosynthesis
MKNKIGVDIEELELGIQSTQEHSGMLAEEEISEQHLPEILFLTSYPPRECGIATYSQDLLKSLKNKFCNTFSLQVCALESGKSDFDYPSEVKFKLDTTNSQGYLELANSINQEDSIKLVMVQHEFGFFRNEAANDFLQLLYGLSKPVIIAFHTVLPQPDEKLKANVRNISAACESIVVMTKNAVKILTDDYGVPIEKVSVIAHGTHLVPHLSKEFLKEKYGLKGKKVLSTFGLLSSGKGIETTLDSLRAIVKINADLVFLIIGKTHPQVIISEGEKYRSMLETKVDELKLNRHVKFINRYLPLNDLLEYLQLTDIYLFTSKDPNQAVSGTFSYAMSCACPIISTPIPHAIEVLRKDTGIIIDFQNSTQLAAEVNRLMSDESLRKSFISGTLQRIVPTAWENSAIAHALLLQKTIKKNEVVNEEDVASDYALLQYRLPEIKLDHVMKMTTDIGIIQFSKINQPDLESGYTLDDNARAMILICMHYELTQDIADLDYLNTYLGFIKFCQQADGNFLNYVDSDQEFTDQNELTNLADANGRAIWALGYVISKSSLLPLEIIETAKIVMSRVLPNIEKIHSTRAMAFAIKGLCYYNVQAKSPNITRLVKILADRLVQMFLHESEPGWLWFESYLTYANSILPEALLCAWQETGEKMYRDKAKVSFDFLRSLIFNQSGIKVISNKKWLHKEHKANPDVDNQHGEQPIDIAYTILALDRFYGVFKNEYYKSQLIIAFNWFMGNNHLHQIIYNPCTGGCYDGLEENNVNFNQGAESAISYLMARLTIEPYRIK